MCNMLHRLTEIHNIKHELANTAVTQQQLASKILDLMIGKGLFLIKLTTEGLYNRTKMV